MAKGKKITAPKIGAKKAIAKAAPKKETAGAKEGIAFVCKLGEQMVSATVKVGDTVTDLLSRAEFPEGAIKNKRGVSVRNLIQAAEADVTAGLVDSVADCFKDIRVNAKVAELDTKIKPGDVITLVPNIQGG